MKYIATSKMIYSFSTYYYCCHSCFIWSRNHKAGSVYFAYINYLTGNLLKLPVKTGINGINNLLIIIIIIYIIITILLNNNYYNYYFLF